MGSKKKIPNMSTGRERIAKLRNLLVCPPIKPTMPYSTILPMIPQSSLPSLEKRTTAKNVRADQMMISAREVLGDGVRR